MKALSVIARAALFLLLVIPISVRLLFQGEPIAGVLAAIVLGALACAATNPEN